MTNARSWFKFGIQPQSQAETLPSTCLVLRGWSPVLLENPYRICLARVGVRSLPTSYGLTHLRRRQSLQEQNYQFSYSLREEAFLLWPIQLRWRILRVMATW
jgi:hypothetical protein